MWRRWRMLLQRPRCWYFRSAHHHCARKGGKVCFAFGGENQYHAIFDDDGCAIVHPSTTARRSSRWAPASSRSQRAIRGVRLR